MDWIFHIYRYRAFFFEMRDSGFVTATLTGERSFGDDRVLSRHFRHAWPPRSQISVRAIIGFGLPEVAVYRDRPTSLGMLKGNIRLQCLTITPDMLYNAVHNIILDCSYCRGMM
ncbi:uncharacterized protein TNCV_1098491, partial [Trichonephila clavipes]